MTLSGKRNPIFMQTEAENMREAIMKKNYRKAFKVIVILAVLLAVFTVVAVPMNLSRQIRDLAALKGSAQEEVLPDSPHGEKQEMEHWKHMITPLSAANYALLGVVTVLWLVLGIYYWLLVVAWLYKSARNEGMNQSLWPILGFFTNLLAVLLFLIIRDNPRRKGRQSTR